VTFIAALICILLGFISAIIDEAILFNALTWFVASISFSVLPGFAGLTFVKKE
jgi:hypothetical protein